MQFAYMTAVLFLRKTVLTIIDVLKDEIMRWMEIKCYFCIHVNACLYVLD